MSPPKVFVPKCEKICSEMPFDVETAVLDFFKEDNDYLSSDTILKNQVKNAIAMREKHDAYSKVKEILHYDNHKMILIVLKHNKDSLNVFREKISEYCQRHKYLNMEGVERFCK